MVLYLRLFGVKKWLRLVSYIWLVAYPLSLLAGAIYTTVRCGPTARNPDGSWLQTCIHDGLIVGVVNGTTSTFSDLLLFVLPLPVVFRLQLPLGQRINLAVVFMTAILYVFGHSTASYLYGLISNYDESSVESLLAPSHCTTAAVPLLGLVIMKLGKSWDSKWQTRCNSKLSRSDLSLHLGSSNTQLLLLLGLRPLFASFGLFRSWSPSCI